MISGTVNESLEAILLVMVRGQDGRSQEIAAIVDTGFSGSLTLSRSVVQALDLPWLCREQGILADGQIHPFDVYSAIVVWDGSEREIEVEAADIDPLLGMSMLSGQRLAIEVRRGGGVFLESLI